MFRYYSAHKVGLELPILGIVLSVGVAGMIGGVGFYLGLLKVNEPLNIFHLAFSAIFVFFMSHNLSKLLDLYQLSWLAYLVLLFAVAFYTALRAPRIFNKTLSKTSQ